MDQIDQYPSNEQLHPSHNQPQEEASYLAVWEERRNRVISILKKHQCSHILDMGCGEGRLFQTMKFMPEFKRLVGIDIDINEIKKSFERVAPITYHIFSDSPPEEPLEVVIYCGDLTISYPSLLREGTDAITMVEVIEHLPPDLLKRLPNVLFGFYRPEVIIISTPNKEYNKCIKGFDLNTFRHWDHKFEWTRKEFQRWCETQVNNFGGYEVTYQTVGRVHPSAEEDFFSVEKYGRCTQIAVFKRLPGANGPYNGNLECFDELNLEQVKNFKFPSKKQIDNLKISYESLKSYHDESDHYEYSEDNTNLDNEVDPEWWQAVWNKEDDDEKAGMGNGQGWEDDDTSVLHCFDDEAVRHCWKSEDFWIEELKSEPKKNINRVEKNIFCEDEEIKSWHYEVLWSEEEAKIGGTSWVGSPCSSRLQSDDDKASSKEDCINSPKHSRFNYSGQQLQAEVFSYDCPPHVEKAREWEFDIESKAEEQVEVQSNQL